jgi:hypothetical protein
MPLILWQCPIKPRRSWKTYNLTRTVRSLWEQLRDKKAAQFINRLMHKREDFPMTRKNGKVISRILRLAGASKVMRIHLRL